MDRKCGDCNMSKVNRIISLEEMEEALAVFHELLSEYGFPYDETRAKAALLKGNMVPLDAITRYEFEDVPEGHVIQNKTFTPEELITHFVDMCGIVITEELANDLSRLHSTLEACHEDIMTRRTIGVDYIERNA